MVYFNSLNKAYARGRRRMRELANLAAAEGRGRSGLSIYADRSGTPEGNHLGSTPFTPKVAMPPPHLPALDAGLANTNNTKEHKGIK